MRRTILFVAVVLLVLGFVAAPAAASRPGGGLGPIYVLDCTYPYTVGEYWTQPTRPGLPNWNYYSDSAKPLAVLLAVIIDPEPPAVPDTEAVESVVPSGLTMCRVFGPVVAGTWTFDGSWGLSEPLNFWGFFKFL